MVDILPTVNAGLDRRGANTAPMEVPADKKARRAMAAELRAEANRIRPSAWENSEDAVARTMRASSLLHTAALIEHGDQPFRDQPRIDRRYVKAPNNSGEV